MAHLPTILIRHLSGLMQGHSRQALHVSDHACVECARASPSRGSRIPTHVHYAYITLAVLCLVMGGMSIVACAVCLKTVTSFRNENDYLNAFIQRHLSNVLFLNKYLFVRDAVGAELSELTSPLIGYCKVHWRALSGYWGAISGHAREYGPALAMALLTTHLLATD